MSGQRRFLKAKDETAKLTVTCEGGRCFLPAATTSTPIVMFYAFLDSYTGIYRVRHVLYYLLMIAFQPEMVRSLILAFAFAFAFPFPLSVLYENFRVYIEYRLQY